MEMLIDGKRESIYKYYLLPYVFNAPSLVLLALSPQIHKGQFRLASVSLAYIRGCTRRQLISACFYFLYFYSLPVQLVLRLVWNPLGN